MIILPEDVKYIISRLNENGYKGYIVGGCVRDCMMGRVPNDWDLATDAYPEDVLSLFSDEHVLPTGLKHGTVTIMLDKRPYEVTTFRVEGRYSDFRRPDYVMFTRSLEDDLKRRDFTINALAYNDAEGLIDISGGIDDIKNEIIRCVGDPDRRFKEDALRMLRAVRFSSQLGFHIEESTLCSICKNSELLKHISSERIREEFNKILVSDKLMNIMYLLSTKLMKYIIPEFYDTYDDENILYSDFQNTVNMMESTGKDTVLRLALLLHKAIQQKSNYSIDGEAARRAGIILNRLRYDKATISKVKIIIMYYNALILPEREHILRWLNKIGAQSFSDLLKVKRAELVKGEEAGLIQLKNVNEVFEYIMANGLCFSRRQLSIKGNDLGELGIKEGRIIGKIMEELLDLVIQHPELNERETLIEYVKSKKYLQ